MSIQRAFNLVRRARISVQSAAAAARRHSTTAADSSASLAGLQFRYDQSTWAKPRWGLLLSGPTVIFLGLNGNYVFADEAYVAEPTTNDDQGQAYVTGLRRIEDGSVISNSHTSKWRIFTDTGRDLYQKGKLAEAEKYFQAALLEAKEGFGPRDPHVASSCNNLAEFYRVRKIFDKAEPLYLEAIKILEDSFGADDIRVGAALHNLGQFYLSQQKLDQARTCYERSLKIKGSILGYGHPDYANTMYHLGTVLHLQGNDKDAETLIQESIKILEDGGQGDTLMCVRRMKYLSQILLNSNRVLESETLQRKVLHILELSKGWDSLDTVIAAETLALTLQSLGSLTEARELLERCLDARKRILPEQHIQVAANILHLARVTLLISNNLRKAKISEACEELDKAKILVDDSIRIAKANLDGQIMTQNKRRSNRESPDSVKDRHVALTILLQSLDFVGLLEVTMREARETYTFPFEAELALRECISIYKEPGLRNLLNSPDVRREYISCLKHLVILVSENTHDVGAQKSKEMQELRDEVRHIEAEISSTNKLHRVKSEVLP